MGDFDHDSMIDLTDTILDCEMEGGAGGFGKASELSSRFNLFIPLSVKFVDGKAEIHYYIGEKELANREIRLFLDSVKAQKTYESWSQRVDEGEVPPIWKEIIRDFTTVKSAVLLFVYIDGGEIRFRFRFHHSDYDNVSDLIMESRRKSQNLRVYYLGKSRGTRNIITEISKKLQLTSIRFYSRESRTDGPWTRIVKSSSHDYELDAVYLSDHTPNNKSLVTLGDNIYEGMSHEDLYEHITNTANDLNIIRLLRIQSLEGDRLETEVILPTIHSFAYLGMLSSIKSGDPKLGIKLIGVYTVP